MELLAVADIPVWWILLPLTCLLVYLYSTWPYSQFQQLGIDGPPPKPFFGNYSQLISKGLLYALLDLSKEYGRVFGIYIGRHPMIIVSDLDMLKSILVKDFGNFTDRSVFSSQDLVSMDEPVKKSVFFARGSDWKRIRSIITPAFSSGKLKLMEPYINRCSQDLAENLLQLAHQGTKMPVKEYYGFFSMDVIAGTAFGMHINSQKDHNDPFLASVREMFSPRGQNFVSKLLAILPSLTPVVAMLRNSGLFSSSGFNYFMDSLDTMIHQRREDSAQSRRVDFMQLVIKAEGTDDTDGSHKHLTTDEIKGQMLLFFAAGYETVAITLQFLTYNLTMYPDVQQRVVAEIEKHLGQDTPTYDNVSKLKYLEQAIQETLRLFPPVVMVNREAAETITIKGVTIPKGFGVGVNVAYAMRDPEYFPDPDVFNPDRFSDKAALDPITFLAFGFGPRICIGMRLAMLEMKIAMVHVLRKLKFVRTPDLPEKIQLKQTVAILMTPTPPLMIKAVPRQVDQ